jgi:hypothetical protein
VELLSDMFKNIWLIFHLTKMLIRERRGRTMGGTNRKLSDITSDIRTLQFGYMGQQKSKFTGK